MIYYGSVESALTIVGSATSGANVFNPVVVQSIGLGQRRGRPFDSSLVEQLILSGVANYEARELSEQVIYFGNIALGYHAGQVRNQTLTMSQELAHNVTANRSLDSIFKINQFLSAYIVGKRETCVTTLGNSTTLEVIAEYSNTLSNNVGFAQSVTVSGTYHVKVTQGLNLSTEA